MAKRLTVSAQNILMLLDRTNQFQKAEGGDPYFLGMHNGIYSIVNKENHPIWTDSLEGLQQVLHEQLKCAERKYFDQHNHVLPWTS